MPVLPTEKLREKKRLVREFRAFVDRGNVVELGVAFVMGATFKTVIDALAGDGGKNPGILGGLIGAIFGGKTPNFNDKGVTLNGSFIPVGSLFTSVLNFLIMGLVMFFVIKAYGRFRKSQADETTNDLLKSIRDELRDQRGS